MWRKKFKNLEKSFKTQNYKKPLKKVIFKVEISAWILVDFFPEITSHKKLHILREQHVVTRKVDMYTVQTIFFYGKNPQFPPRWWNLEQCTSRRGTHTDWSPANPKFRPCFPRALLRKSHVPHTLHSLNSIINWENLSLKTNRPKKSD